jgi:hypothetical protein
MSAAWISRAALGPSPPLPLTPPASGYRWRHSIQSPTKFWSALLSSLPQKVSSGLQRHLHRYYLLTATLIPDCASHPTNTSMPESSPPSSTLVPRLGDSPIIRLRGSWHTSWSTDFGSCTGLRQKWTVKRSRGPLATATLSMNFFSTRIL